MKLRLPFIRGPARGYLERWRPEMGNEVGGLCRYIPVIEIDEDSTRLHDIPRLG